MWRLLLRQRLVMPRAAEPGIGVGQRLLGSLADDCAGGHEMHGGTVYAPLPEATVPCTVTSSVAYDPEGERRDG